MALCFGLGVSAARCTRPTKPALCGRTRAGARAGARQGHVRMADAGSVTKQIESEDFLERIRAVNRMDELGVSERVAALVRMATADKNQQVRYAALGRLAGMLPGDVSVEDKQVVLDAARLVLLNDKEVSCQAVAADVIAGMKLTEGFEDLVAAFERSSDWMLRLSIAAGMGEMGDERAFEFLKGVLEGEGDPLLMAAALGAVGELGDERGVAVVERFLESEDVSIRERAAMAHNNLLGKE